MIYNDAITSEYGEGTFLLGGSPIAYQPTPTETDYKNGYFVRWFAKRANQNVAIEISPSQRSGIDNSLYATVSLTWKISGPRDPLIVNGIIDRSGVENGNITEIERVLRETEIDLRQSLKNPLELWRGY